jgi:hypothetical protein
MLEHGVSLSLLLYMRVPDDVSIFVFNHVRIYH